MNEWELTGICFVLSLPLAALVVAMMLYLGLISW
jgi:hypothetical protein